MVFRARPPVLFSSNKQPLIELFFGLVSKTRIAVEIQGVFFFFLVVECELSSVARDYSSAN